MSNYNQKKLNENLDDNNIIIASIKINKDQKKQRIINSYQNLKREESNFWNWENIKPIENEEQIKDCEIYINDKKISFDYYHTFQNEGIYNIKYKFNTLLESTNFMFHDCKSLISLNLSQFNCTNIIDTKYMFYNCESLKSIDLSNFNTQNVSNMKYMFYNCYSLKSLDLSNFNTEKVNNMGYMFSNCFLLKILNLSNFNTKNVINMEWMFSECNSLISLDLSNFNTKKSN